jgi:hypothetical protein
MRPLSTEQRGHTISDEEFILLIAGSGPVHSVSATVDSAIRGGIHLALEDRGCCSIQEECMTGNQGEAPHSMIVCFHSHPIFHVELSPHIVSHMHIPIFSIPSDFQSGS